MSKKTRSILTVLVLGAGVALVGCGESSSPFEPQIVDTTNRELLPQDSDDPADRQSGRDASEQKDSLTIK